MIFIDNKYTKCYFRIIEKNKNTHKIFNKTERHHIIPKSFFISEGGWLDGQHNHKSNLVNLSIREHRLCHLLLTRMVDTSTAYFKMVSAAKWMLEIKKNNNGFSKGRLYERLRLIANSEVSRRFSGKPPWNKGVPQSLEHTLKISKSMMGSMNPFYGKTHSAETREKLRVANTGKQQTEKTKEAVRRAHTGKIVSNATREKMANSKKRPVIANGIAYNSLIEAAIALNVDRNTITNRIKSDKISEYYYLQY